MLIASIAAVLYNTPPIQAAGRGQHTFERLDMDNEVEIKAAELNKLKPNECGLVYDE